MSETNLTTELVTPAKNKVVAWPSVPAGISVEIAFRCSKCNNVLRLCGKKEPQDADAMFQCFVRKHTLGDCH